MKLSINEIIHVANLARLDLSQDELKLYEKQLSNVLDYIDQLSEVDTVDVEETAQVTGLENVLREDEVLEWDKNEIENALNEAPEIEDRQVKVHKVL